MLSAPRPYLVRTGCGRSQAVVDQAKAAFCPHRRTCPSRTRERVHARIRARTWFPGADGQDGQDKGQGEA